MADRIEFQKIGGDYQLVLEQAQDMSAVPELNAAHWAMTSVRMDSLLCDPDFLKFVDADSNGIIRIDEVKAAVRWLLSVIRSPQELVCGSDTLSIDTLNPDNAEAAGMIETIKVALANLKMKDAKSISLEQISDQQKIISDALQNGDGVIPADAVSDTVTAECIRKIASMIGSRKDLSGADGITDDELKIFEEQSDARLQWLDEAEKNKKSIFVYGSEKTAAIYDLYKAVEAKIDEFFLNCEALSLSVGGSGRVAVQNTLDPMDKKSVESFLESAPVAPVNSECILDLDQVRHPVWRKKVTDFFESLDDYTGKIAAADWQEIKAKLAPYKAWITAKPETKIESWDAADLRSLKEKKITAKIHEFMEKDVAVKKELDNCKIVRKLILFQKYMLEFLNNYVTLDRLFDRKKNSMIQAGKLVLDGRVFTLCTVVQNVAEHKKIAADSNICVLYLDIVTGTGADEKKNQIAVAVTSGNVRHIFIGKSGVFVTGDDTVWNAKVFDVVQQPVSLREAFLSPFFKFGEFLQKQADRFFTSRSKQYEDGISNDIQSKSTLTPPNAPAQTPAVSGSMLLMGSGVGIAAIGSAFAFMVKSIQGISVGTVLTVFFCILLVFGGPIVLLSLNKLLHRNMSVFLEANGYALNGQMRLSFAMGRFFTFHPQTHGHYRLFRPNLAPEDNMRIPKWRWYLLGILLLSLIVESIVFAWICCKYYGGIPFFK